MELSYNNKPLKLDIPSHVHLDVFAPAKTDEQIEFNHFESLLKQSKSDAFLSNGSILFIVNDAHRSTPTVKILKWIYKYNPEIISKANYIIACGTHEPPSGEQYIQIFGDLYNELKDRISYHDCRDYDSMTKVGVDKFGEDVWLDSKIFDYDKLFVINSVEPHYFAGFTGGRKSFVPGLADFKTIERNHNLANSLDCAPLKLEGNPMAEHLISMLELVDTSNVMTLQIVYDSQKKISSLHFGDIRNAFKEAVESAKKIYACKVSDEYDTVLLEILPPLDKHLYQAQKALENSQAVVKDGGSAIVVSSCEEGIGSEHFYKLAENWDAENNKPKDGKLHFGSHKLSRVNAISKRINALIYSNLSNEIVSKVFYKSVESLDRFIKEDSNKKENYRMALVYDAAHTVLTK